MNSTVSWITTGRDEIEIATGSERANARRPTERR